MTQEVRRIVCRFLVLVVVVFSKIPQNWGTSLQRMLTSGQLLREFYPNRYMQRSYQIFTSLVTELVLTYCPWVWIVSSDLQHWTTLMPGAVVLTGSTHVRDGSSYITRLPKKDLSQLLMKGNMNSGAMTDGAAKTLEICNPSGEMFKQAYSRLTSRNPSQFWTSGQWMTERQGGSDVANGTETIAMPQADGTYRLYGYKWFSSATDADITLTLARVKQPDGSTIPGSKGLTMFYLETRDSDGQLNNIEIQRLKNKLGTRQLPTAELLLDGTIARKITGEGRGVAGIANMLTITRIHNSISAVSAMRRILSLAQDYCLKRSVFGKLLVEHKLHMQTLARLEVEVRGAVLLVMEVSRLLGLEDCKMASEEELHLLRLLTPITKLYTAKQAMMVTSEGLESFGGQGYIEDTGLPGIMRDAQVLSIWEGTTNVLSLDVLRSIHKTQGQVLKAFHSSVLSKLSLAKEKPALQSTCNAVQTALSALMSPKHVETLTKPVVARDLAFSLARIYTGALLVEHACWNEAHETDTEAARRWCLQDMIPVLTNLDQNLYDNKSTSLDIALVMDVQKDDPLVEN